MPYLCIVKIKEQFTNRIKHTTMRTTNNTTKENRNMKMIEEIRTNAELQELNNALLNAVNAAAMLDETEDGGTCNFDSVTLKIKISAELVSCAWVRLDKMLVRDYGRMWRGCYMVDIPLSGQANRRTRMAEAACKELINAGYNAFVYYQCD